MSAISAGRTVISVGGNFAPNLLDTDATGFAVLPDYAQQATVSGATAGVTVTQYPAPGTLVHAGSVAISIRAEDADGNEAQTGFEVNVRDRTAPVVSKQEASWSLAVLTSPAPMPDFTGFMSVSDNVAVTRVQQSPAPGTITSVGSYPVTITASDAAGNAGTFTFQVTVDAAVVEGQPHYSSIAAKGMLVPGSGTMGIPAGAIFKTFGTPSINDSRATAFVGTWVKGSQTGKTILAGNPLQPVAGLAQPAPGIAGATFSVFQHPVLNNAGTSDSVAFLADVTGPGITRTDNTGVWTNLGGQLQLLARENAPAPGTTALFKSFTAINLFADEVLITATLTGPGVSITSSNDAGVWSWSADRGMHLVLREGQPILEGKTLATSQILAPISGSMGHGRHHLDKGFHAARITCTDGTNAAIYVDCTGPSPCVLPVAASRTAIVPGATATSIGTPSGNAFGSAAFTATLSGGPGLIFSHQQADGRFANRIALRRGDTIASGLAWNTFRDPVMNADGAAAWLGRISGATTSDDDVLAFTTAGGTPAIVAREGAAAPGTGSAFRSFTSVALPDGAAGPLFVASLRVGTGAVTVANDSGLWAVSSTGEIVLLLREGGDLDSRIIKRFQTMEHVSGSPGQARSYNSTGSVIVLLTFTDRSQSILRVDLP